MNCPHCATPVLGSETVCMACHRRLDYARMRQGGDAARTESASLPRIHNKYFLEVLLALVGIGAALLLLLVGSLLGWDFLFAVTLPLALGLGFVVSLFLAWVKYAAASSAIHLLLTDQETRHWTYSEEEWQRFASQEWQRAIRHDVLIGGGLLGLMLVLGLIIWISGAGDATTRTLFILAIVGMVVFLGLLVCLKDRLIFLSRRRQRTGAISISLAGLIVGGWYRPLGGLERVIYTPGEPAMLRFCSRQAETARQIEVPVPPGREAEAEQVVSEFNHERR